MNKPKQESIKASLDRAAESSVDEAVQDKLNLARRNALSQLDTSSTSATSSESAFTYKTSVVKWFVPLGGLALVASLSFVFLLSPSSNIIFDDTTPFTNGDIMVLSEDINLLEDLQFYEWMLSEET